MLWLGLLVLPGLPGVAWGWQGTCFVDSVHMAHCCDQPKRCFGPEKIDRSWEECCGVEFQQLLIKSAAKELRNAEDLNTLGEIYLLLATFLNFLNYDNVDAWELIAHTAGKRALAEYNAFTSFAEDMASHFDSESFRQQKFHVMKEINHAAHLIENFFQVAWYDHSRQIGKSPVETDINEVRPRFENALKVYQVVQNAADTLLYDAVARYGMIPGTPRLSTAPEVVLVLTVVGPWASVGIVTFWSILRTRSTPLRVFIFGDQAGIRDWRAMMRTVKSATPHVMHRLRFDYIDIFQHPRMIAYFSRLPSECAASNMSKALYARLLCHELLPLDVERAIAMDLGDILVFEDILGLWEEGDHLQPDELLAAASHRSQEESLRQTKPSELNGGVVLYEVSRMRQGNYTEDTLRAAIIGLEKGYQHFCVWDQDILNAMREDLWGLKGVRLLPCRWSIFPMANWQFFWNTPSFWLRELVERRRYPGLLAADHFEHFCPNHILMLHTVFAFEKREHRQLARNVALAQGIRNQQPGSSIKAPDGTRCACGERASLLHVPSTMKLWPWVQRLFRFHSPSFLPEVHDEALFRSRNEQGEELGGGFWGSEDSKDLEIMRQGTLEWARDTGSSVVSGNCATTPTSLGNYAHIDFPNGPAGEVQSLKLKAQTNASQDAHLFFGTIYTVPNGLQSLGLELVIDAFEGTKSILRWGIQGEEIAEFRGRILERGQWTSLWVDIKSSGEVQVAAGESGNVFLDIALDITGTYDLTHGKIYAGSLGQKPAHWLLCRE